MADNFKVPSTLPDGDPGVGIHALERTVDGNSVKVGVSVTVDPADPTKRQAVDGTYGAAVDVKRSALPAGAATSANQETANASLSSIDGKAPALVGGRVPVDGSGVTQPVSGPLTDAQLRATAVPVSVASVPTHGVTGPLTDSELRASAVPVSAASLPLPSGAATAAKQDAAQTSLGSIDGKLPALVSSRVPVDGSGVTQPVSAAALPLPSGAATAANQATEISSLSSIDGKTPALGQALEAGSVPVVLPAAQVSALTPPAAITGFATSAKQDTAQSSLDAIAAALAGTLTVTGGGGGTQYAEDTAHVSGDMLTMAGVVQKTADAALSNDGDRSLLQVDENGFLKVNVKATASGSGGLTDTELRASAVPVSLASAPLPTGAATAAKQDTGNASLSSIDGKLPALVSSRVPVDGSAVTQPVSAAALPLPSGAATAANQATEISSLSSIDGKTPSLGQALAAGSVPVVLTAAQVSALTPPAAITNYAAETGGNLAAAATVLGATGDAAVTTDTTGTISGKLRGLVKWAFERMPASLGQLAKAASLSITVASDDDMVGSKTESAPASDTASSGINGRLQRIAQRLTSLIALLPTSLAAGGGLKVEGVANGVAQPISGAIKNSYVASSAVTISPASLGSDANFLAGRESNAIDNSSNKYTDYLLSGQITTGTSPTVDKEIRVYVVGISNDSTWPDVFDGTDSAETVTNAGIRDSICKLAAVMRVTATSNVAYWFGPVSVASLFGGVVPLKFVVFVTHNTAVNLNSTAGNHVVSITPVYQTIA